MLRTLLTLASLALCACASSPQIAPGQPACTLSTNDKAWVDRAVDAWRVSVRQITHITPSGSLSVVLFDNACALVSANALTTASSQPASWMAAPHDGNVPLPNGDTIPAGVTSFSTGDDGSAYFVMSTPSIWSAAGVRGDPLDLETLMIFVALHEGSHVAQAATYGRRMEALSTQHQLDVSFNDDSMQRQFEANDTFAASIAQEVDLFLRAASAADNATARALAREARALMRLRAERYFVGELTYYTEAEDIWLTMEGSGQWAGYQWLIHQQGMALPPERALEAGMRTRWWSQDEGLAIALVLDRLGPTDWHRIAFGAGSMTLLELLDEALA